MLNSDFLVIVLKASVTNVNNLYPRKLLLEAPTIKTLFFCKRQFFLFAGENRKTYAWLTENLHGIVWEAGSYDHTFMFNSLNGLNFRFPNNTVFTKGTEKCISVRILFQCVADLDTLCCPRPTQFSYCST